MDKGKSIIKKSSKGPQPSGKLIALGGSRPRDAGSKHVDSKKSSSCGTKREATSLLLPQPVSKKPMFGATFSGRDDRRASPTPQMYLFEERAKEVPPENLFQAIQDANASDDEELVEQLMCGAVRYLKANRIRPAPAMFLSLMYLAKCHSNLFVRSDVVVEAFCSLLRRELQVSFKTKGNPTVPILACNVLFAAFQDREIWPDKFIKVYLEDSLGERVWVDRKECRGFVDNIQTAFGTKPVAEHLLQDQIVDSTPDESHNVFSRYANQTCSVAVIVNELLKEQLSRRQGVDVPRNLLRVMSVCCGLGEVKAMAAQRFEIWLQNPKLTRAAQDLLLTVCHNCDSSTSFDIIAQLCRLRIKAKPLISHYLLSIKELMTDEKNLEQVLMQCVYNELTPTPTRSPHNMIITAAALQEKPSESARILATIFQSLLCKRDDYLRALRVLLREIVKCCRGEILFKEFAFGLMQERFDEAFNELDGPLKLRMIMSITELITETALLSVTPSVRATSQGRSDPKDSELLNQFRIEASLMQRDAVRWLHHVAPKMISLTVEDYIQLMRKVLFMERNEGYFKGDNWPTESERNLVMRLVTEIPVQEATLGCILLTAHRRDMPINAIDSLEFAEQLVRRAAKLTSENFNPIEVAQTNWPDLIFELCQYHYPDNIVLPKNYEEPILAVLNCWWKAWLLLLLMAVHNPMTLGRMAWENYPTLRCMMEMIMTNQFKFPPPTMVGEDVSVEDLLAQERQTSFLEKEVILVLEGHLAAATSGATITEENSLLLSQVTSLKLQDAARCPPQPILEQLQALSQQLLLGPMMCRCRDPDFLLDMIQRQGSSKSMPWLAELVEASESSLEILPVQCLCEFLLHENTDESLSGPEKHKQQRKVHKQEQLLMRLQGLLHSQIGELHAVSEVLAYFLHRLAAPTAEGRLLAAKGLSLVLSKSHIEMDDVEVVSDNLEKFFPGFDWLLKFLPNVPQFAHLVKTVCQHVRAALVVEVDAGAIAAYLYFLATYTERAMPDAAVDVSQLLVERFSLLNYLIPSKGRSEMAELLLSSLISLLHMYIVSASSSNEWIKYENEKSNDDLIFLKWNCGKEAVVDIRVVHATIFLLTIGIPSGQSQYQQLFDCWLPELPTAYLADRSVKAVLLPDWLRLRMVRSSQSVLVDAGLAGVTFEQLIAFVQSFGIPVSAMSRLLAALDDVLEDEENVKALAVDKNYMALLIEVQHARGAMGGARLKSLLGLEKEEGEIENDPEKPKPVYRKKTSSHQSKSSSKISKISSAEALQRALVQCFSMEKSGHVTSERRRSVRSVLACITKGDRSLVEGAIHSLGQLMRDSSFVDGVEHFLCFSLPLFKILMQQCTSVFPDLNSRLSAVLVEMKRLLSERKMLYEIVDKFTVSMSNKSKPHVPISQILSGVGGVSQIEESLNTQLWSTLSHSKSCIEQVSALLALPASSNTGLLLDWMPVLDPQLILSAPGPATQLLFGGLRTGLASNHPYLLCLLIHQTSWSMLRLAVELILARNSLCPSAVLDFLWACIHNPKLWQGKERNTPKHARVEDVLRLSEAQLNQCVNYVIREAQSVQDDPYKTEHDVSSLLAYRLQLLLRCNQLSSSASSPSPGGSLHVLLDQLKTARQGESSVITGMLVTQLYLKVPGILALLPNDTLFLYRQSMHGTSSMDVLTHRLLTAMATAGADKLTEMQMQEAYLVLRQIASRHPVLVLRQLPMLGSLLQGRSQFSFGELCHRRHLLLYTLLLGILDMLAPLLYKVHCSILDSLFKFYFELLKNHGVSNVQLGSLVTKFIKILHDFLADEANAARKILHPHLPVLRELGQLYPSFPPLMSLLAGLSLPVKPGQPAERRHLRARLPLPAGAATFPSFHEPQLNSSQPVAELIKTLREIDERSKRNVDCLGHCSNEIQKLMRHPNILVRNPSHQLAVRYLKHNPSAAVAFVPVFMLCLSHDEPDVVVSALEHVPDLVLLAPEHAVELLMKVFLLKVCHKMESMPALARSLQILTLQSAA